MKLTFTLFLFLSLVVLSCTTVSPAFADTIAVNNPSFEITNPLNIPCGVGCAYNNGPIPGWTSVGGEQGSWQPSSAYFSSPVPNGSIVAYSNFGTISQTLTASLIPNTTYNLTVDVGHRLDGLVNNYMIELFAGTTLLQSLSGSNGVITPGTFAAESLTYTSGSVVPSGNLDIVLFTAGPQVDFDNVQLTNSVPEPASLTLLAAGLGLILFFRRR